MTSTLQERGFKAFVVGGAVRDLLLGRDPKDFDVATDATPEEVRTRVPPLAHHRAALPDRALPVRRGDGGGVHLPRSGRRGGRGRCTDDAHGRLLRDNVWGTQEEDALRRDFTVNALFYDPTTQEILDYCGGWDDLQKKRLRMIGDPERRYREDPVRMLRAVRLAAKLGLADRARHAQADQPLADLAAERAAGAPVRRDAEAAAVRPRDRKRRASCAKMGCITGCCRCWT